ncbi:MAG: SDR family NAD(P)-dependent oxidoreductase [Alphaproteobacteria bacterium]|nr:SDR family NAD(P)-dependent oxidoreductase [Alphaproteobacteria bacterium]HJP22176.1 SDR family NAD(P)-dependent oxidoreductase [Alphaproteobacteria bacterium]
MAPRLKDRVALVTGASRGLGAAVAERFAAEGAHVILVARNVGGLEECDDRVKAAGGSATLVPLDLSDGAGIDRLGAAVAERWGRLDVLLGNAAMLGGLSPVGHFDPETWDQVLAINTTANWRLIRSFDPLLRAAEAGRAIFVTSGVTQGVFPYWAAYAASKSALEAMVQIYAAEVHKTAVRANLINPGPLATRLRAQAFPGEDPDELAQPESITDVFVDLASAECQRNGEIVNAT